MQLSIRITTVAALCIGVGQLHAATLTLNGTDFKSGTGPTITASFSGHTGGTTTDWIGIYPQGEVPDGSPASTWWSYVDGTQSSGSANAAGHFSTINNADLGNWIAHFLSNDGYGHVPGDTTVNFTISAPAGITVTPDQSQYSESQTVNIAWAGNLGVVSLDWVGIYAAGAVPGVVASIDYKYAPTAAGSVSFTGLSAGDDDVYLLANDAYYVLG